MRAAVMRTYGAPLVLEEVPDPAVPEDGVVVAVRASGVCRSDLHGWLGHDAAIRLPHVPGHEFAGEVVAAGPQVRRVRVGDRVTAPFCCGCGRCDPCRQGETQICDVDHQPGFTAWGAWAERVAIPFADLNCVALPPGVAFDEAAALGCRCMTAFAAVAVRGEVGGGDWVAVHGCGGVGLAAVMMATALGASVVAVDVEPRALELAAALGARVTVDARACEDPAEEVRAATGGGAHLSLDALGSPATCAGSIRSLRKRGRHVQVGLLVGGDATPPVPMAEVVSRELSLLGVHGMAVRHYPALLRLVESGALQPGRLVQRRIGLDGAGAALAAMRRGGPETAGITVIESR